MVCSCRWHNDIWPSREESVTLSYFKGGTEIPSGTEENYTAMEDFSFTPQLVRDYDGAVLDTDGWTFVCVTGSGSDIALDENTGILTGTSLKFREETLIIKAVPKEGTKPDSTEKEYVPCSWNAALKIVPVKLTVKYDRNTAELNRIKYRAGIELPESGEKVKKPTVTSDSGTPGDLIFSISTKPDGIQFDRSTGAITGTGSTAGKWTAAVTARNDYYLGTADIYIELTDEESSYTADDEQEIGDAVTNAVYEGGGTVTVTSSVTLTSNLSIPAEVGIELDNCSLTGSNYVTQEDQGRITALITTQNGLENFASTVNSGFAHINGKLNESVGSDTFNITPAGSETNPYSGNFNGMNHTITVGINRNESYTGIFGCTGAEGKIENLIVSGTVTVSGENGKFAAGIAGKNLGTINSCINKAAVSGRNHTGGIAGTNDNNGIIINCCNTGSITGSDSKAYAGGIAGNNWGKNDGSCTASIQNCYNSGNVSGGTYAGGIAGGNENRARIYNCYSKGTTTTGQIAGYSGKDASYNASYQSIIEFCYGINGENITGSEDAIYSSTYSCYTYNANYQAGGTDIAALLNAKVTDENGFSQWKKKSDTDMYPVFNWE